MQTHGNTLYVQTQGAYLKLSGETVQVKVDDAVKLTVPFHHLAGVVCFGRVSISTPLLGALATRGIEVAFLDERGTFQARVVSAVSGNVLLRREQYRRADRPEACLAIARPIIAAKIQNCRNTVLRAARETDDAAKLVELQQAANRLACSLDTLTKVESLDAARGCEGEAARVYFGTFDHLIRQQNEHFTMTERSRRPPLDPLNALLSFVYAVLTSEMAGALEAVGLDPAVGFLHADRPGRLSLALDLLEEFRTLVADRLVLSLINLRQVQPDGFEVQPGGAVVMNEATRRTVLAALTKRKKDEVTHPVLGEKATIGLLPHLQARLLARHLRGDLAEYPALVLK